MNSLQFRSTISNPIKPITPKIALASVGSYEFVSITDIIRCEGWEKYTRIHLRNGTTFVSSYNIGVYKEKLETHGFFCTHKSHLVNEHAIYKYLKEGIVIMSDQSIVPVSRRKREKFVLKFLSGLKPNLKADFLSR